MKEDFKVYLGDGVYAVFDGYGIELRANSHDKPTDVIYLEPLVLEALDRFRVRCSNLEQEVEK